LFFKRIPADSMRLFFATTALLLSISTTKAQNLSENHKLESLCRVWGFLKYYHPQVAKGKFDWDEELILKIQEVQKIDDKETLSNLYLHWIDTLGKIRECKSCLDTDQIDFFDKNFDLTWIDDGTIFTKSLSEKLHYIKANRFQGKNHYVKADRAGNAKITNEPSYKNFEYPTTNYRLLSLFKYWNIIEYFFPYKYMTDQDWDEVLTEMLPKFQYAKDTTVYHLAMLETVAKIDDSHAYFRTPWTHQINGGQFAIPFRVRLEDDHVLVTGYLNDSIGVSTGVLIGDRITHVDGKSYQESLKDSYKYIPASNLQRKKSFGSYYLLNGKDKSISLTFKRGDSSFTKNIERFPYKDFNYESKPHILARDTVLKGNIGYVNMGKVKMIKSVDTIMDKLKDCKGIIFDIRNYPSGTYRRFAAHLVPERTPFVKIITPYLSYPGRFIWKNSKYHSVGGIKKKNVYQGKVVLLVYGRTQSHAEYSAMALQTAPKVITMGTQTAGADGTVSPIEFVGGYKTRFSGNGIFYPDGTETQRKGIKIDIRAKDSVLEKAMSHLKRIAE